MTKAGKRGGAKDAKSKKGAGPRAPAQQVSAGDLFVQAQIALQFDDIDGAKQALKTAVKMAPTDAALLDAYGCLLAEVEDPGALTALQQAVEAAPQSGHEKYMYLAQLEEDCDKALSHSSTGLCLLHQRLHAAKTAAASGASTSAGDDDDEEVDEVAVLTQALSSALCTHAEMLVQKAVAERDAAAAAAQQENPIGLDASVAQQVETMCAQSKELSPKSPEPGQLLASLYCQQGKMEEALAALRGSMALWFKPSPDSDDEKEGAEGGGDAMEEDEGEEELPSQEFRVECVKLLLELDETTHAAIEILEGLVEEDDSNPDIWHLLGLALYSGHHYDEALEASGKATTLLQQMRVPRNDEVWAEMEDLNSAIKEAMGVRAAEAGAAGMKK